MPLPFALLAQSESSTLESLYKVLYLLGIVFLVFVVPFVIGKFLERRLRMEKYGGKIGLILASLMLSVIVLARTWKTDDDGQGYFDFKLGVDLKGGVILIYEVDDNATLPGEEEMDQRDRFSMSALVEALSRRINPSGTKEIVIRPYGERQVEIIIPEVDQREVEQIKKGISTAGVLQFRIVANPRDHQDVIELARQAAVDPLKKRGRIIYNDQNEAVGLWTRVAREQGDFTGPRPFKLPVGGAVVRDSGTGDLLEVPLEHRGDTPDLFAQYVADQGIKEIDILMATNDGYDVTGAHLGAVSSGYDEVLNPCILFNLKGEGVDRFAGLTREFSPQGNFERQLGIVLDNELLSAPNIQEMIQGRGRITGRFTPEEVTFMVNILQAGSLPVVLNKSPISENLIDPLLGEETVRQGKYAIVISISMVLVFIVCYYRFAGLVACFALLANLLFILAWMVSIQAALTLPGLAGLVLTVGMSVDANVLIFERIREEMSRGSALRMAIRNGFARATTTIVDANVTTLITAIVLYAIGTDQIRGFAVTLILGILMSMYTAIFCSRVIFDIAERSHRITALKMSQLLGATQIDFIGKRAIAAVCSLVLISVGLVGIVVRGADIFDIDFRGGTSVHIMFAEPAETKQVRDQLDEKFRDTNIRFTVTAMNNTAARASNNIFKVDSSLVEVEELQTAIQEAFDGSGMALATYSLKHGQFREVPLEATPAPSSPEAEPAETPDTTEPLGSDTRQHRLRATEGVADLDGADLDGANRVAGADTSSSLRLALADEVTQQLAQLTDSVTDSVTDPGSSATETADADAAGDASDAAAEPPSRSQLEVELTFGHAINADTLRAEIEQSAQELNLPLSYFELVNANWDGESSNAFAKWTLRIPATQSQTDQLLQHLEQRFASTPVWPSSNKIGGQVAGRMQNKAIAALLTSLLGIVVYIWIRFQRVVFGLAAVVALIHDLLVTIGAIALSAWLTTIFGFLLIEEFKISLPIVAALLTIIGYSLNDTIVVFDRIREVKGKSPDLTGEMINKSINQTLSRTLLTSMTTLLVVVILYTIGGQGIHGFAYSLVIGVIVGTYSSIFVASPALLWMTGSQTAPRGKSAAA